MLIPKCQNMLQSVNLTLWNSQLDTLGHNFACVANGLMAKTKKDEPPDMDSSSLPHFDCRLSKYFQCRQFCRLLMCHSLFRGIVLNAFEQKKSIRYILGIIFIALMEKYFTLPLLHQRLIIGIAYPVISLTFLTSRTSGYSLRRNRRTVLFGQFALLNYYRAEKICPCH